MASTPRLLLIGMDGMNLPLLRRFASEGSLPTFSQLMAGGSTNRLLPALPAWTPNNWATIITGTTPGSHHLGGWTLRRKTDGWDAPRLESWDSRIIGDTETIWHVAEEAGLRTLVQFYPVAVWPSPLRRGYIVAPGFHDAPFAIAMPMRYLATRQEDVQAHIEQVGAVARERTTDLAEMGAPPGTSVVRLRLADGWTNAPAGALAAELPIVLKTGETESAHLLVVPDEQGRTFTRVAVCAERNGLTAVADLTPGAWSRFVHCRLGAARTEVAMRYRLLRADPAAGTLYLCRTEAYATRGFAHPDGLDDELTEACGPFYDWPTIDPTLGPAELDTFASDMQYQGEWQVKAARYLLERWGWDLHFSHWHLFDHINHPTVNPADPDGPNYDAKRGEWMIECQRRIYQVADGVLAQFLELAGRETLVCVTSDHGMAPAHRWADVPARLAEAGLLVYRGGGRTVDWRRSAAYTQADRGSEVYVNLRGREPEGIVAPEEYERVQEAIVDALLGWRDPGTGKRPVAVALKIQDAQIIGYWNSDDNGDVVLTFNRGYGWGPPLDGRTAGPGKEALHGSQIPTSETTHFTNLACFILAGPGIRVGYERDWRRYGLMRMVDLAPTLAHLLGLRPPRHSTGAVLTDLFER
ncbi:MAG TPA: alkaline phosphatase family protein [bacterium]|nr:alkaline phosphatase family protein [bacterium]